MKYESLVLCGHVENCEGFYRAMLCIARL